MIRTFLQRLLAVGRASEAGFASLKTCPECGSKVSCQTGPREEDIGGVCPNPDCPAQVRRRVERWCSREAMDVAGGHGLMVAQLVKAGLVLDVADLYKLSLAEVAALDRVGEASARELLNGVQASRERDLWRLVLGLGILDVGPGASRALGRTFASLDELRTASLEELAAVDEVGPVLAESLFQWFNDNRNRALIERLRKAELNFHSALHPPT